jgi:ribosomal protein L12E/L44/L45/RPP1/RPP2
VLIVDYKELITSDIRLVILRTLAEDDGYSLNESVLQSILSMFGHKVSRDRVKTELSWLKEQDLVTIETAISVQVATITSRGLDVASGHVVVPGVKRPGPRDC